MGNRKEPRKVGRSSSNSSGTWPRKTSISVPWLIADAIASTRASWGPTAGIASSRSSTWRGDANQTLAATLAVECEEVAHSIDFGAQVLQVDGVRRDRQRHTLDHLNAATLERGTLRGIVGEQAHLTQAHEAEDFSSGGVLAAVDRQTQRQIGVDRVESLVLQGIRPDFVGQADATPLLRQIQQNARAGLGDHCQRGRQLLATVAAQ